MLLERKVCVWVVGTLLRHLQVRAFLDVPFGIQDEQWSACRTVGLALCPWQKVIQVTIPSICC